MSLITHRRLFGPEYDPPFVQVERPRLTPHEDRFAIVPGTIVRSSNGWDDDDYDHKWDGDNEDEMGSKKRYVQGIVISASEDGHEVTVMWNEDPTVTFFISSPYSTIFTRHLP